MTLLQPHSRPTEIRVPGVGPSLRIWQKFPKRILMHQKDGELRPPLPSNHPWTSGSPARLPPNHQRSLKKCWCLGSIAGDSAVTGLGCSHSTEIFFFFLRYPDDANAPNSRAILYKHLREPKTNIPLLSATHRRVWGPDRSAQRYQKFYIRDPTPDN